TEKGAGSKPTLLASLPSAKHAELPAVTVGIMEPQAHVFRTRCLRTDFVARIFNIDFDGFQLRERLSQSRHVLEMIRHVIDRFRRRFSFKYRNLDVAIHVSDANDELAFFSQ